MSSRPNQSFHLTFRGKPRQSGRLRRWADSRNDGGRDMPRPASFVLALLLLAAAVLGGCRRGNGLPSDLIRHLARQGITITPVRVQAPLSSRGGYVVAHDSPAVAANIVATFKLQRIAPDDEQWGRVIERAGGAAAVKEMWGIAGRPVQFRLKNGGQFEYFYLIVTQDGFTYLLAEYAYG